MAAAPLAMAGASIIGSVLGGKGQKEAAKKAATITANDNAANRSFLTNIYNQNAAAFTPWATTGATANNAIMALLGYPQGGAHPSAFGASGAPAGSLTPSAFGGGFGAPVSDGWAPDSGWGGAVSGSMPGPVPGGITVPDARSAFDTYRGSTGYDFRVNEGVRALQSAFSRNLDSGGASKAAIRYGQGVGSDEFARYMGYLTGQSQLGLSGASALAGVSQNFGNNVVAGNQSAATAAANAKLYAGNANANMWAGIGSSFGQGIGASGKGW